jgi:putative peptide zinc metalloprotease protein
MTVAAGHVTAPVQPPADAPGPAEPPRLADGVELLGEYQDSGYSQPPSLVRRPDGQVIQMSPLLYRVACRIDGIRDPAAIATLVSEDLGRALSADQVRYLLTTKLLPLGIVSGNRTGAPPKANPLLALRARGTLLPERVANAAGTLLRPLFRLPMVIAVVGCILAVDYWLFAVHGLGGGVQQLLRDPVDLLVVLGLTVVSAAFHECGHATGCRYGGARSGLIGVGIYLVWPSFFTNVTDSYRLSRAGRLRTDLGGLYFNLIFMLALAGIYAATSAEILLLVIAITHLEMLEQLLPFVRFDGYFILSDLAGVPDLFARAVPIVRSRHRYAMAAVDAIGFVLLALSLAGSLYIVAGLTRRLTTAGLRWSAGRPRRRFLVAVAGAACLALLASFWTAQGQFRGW